MYELWSAIKMRRNHLTSMRASMRDLLHLPKGAILLSRPGDHGSVFMDPRITFTLSNLQAQVQESDKFGK
jgi:hypothetical protein